MRFIHVTPVLLAILSSGLTQASESSLLTLGGRPVNLFTPFGAAAERGTAMRKMTDYLSEHFKLAPGRETLRYSRTQVSPGMKTIKADLLVDGIPVHGGAVAIHASSFGRDSYSSELPRTLPNSLQPKVSKKQALAIASLYSANPLRDQPILKLLPRHDGTRMDLVWWVDFRSTAAGAPGAQVVVNALTGKVIGEISQLQTLSETKVYNAHESGIAIGFTADGGAKVDVPYRQLQTNRLQSKITGCIVFEPTANGKWTKTQLPVEECIATIRAENSRGAKACQIINAADGSFYNVLPENCEVYSQNGKIIGTPDTSADNATTNGQMVYDYYSDRFGRRSFDGNNTVLRSVVKVGSAYANAAWMGDLNFMVYGFGDGKEIGDFTQLVDVAGHEMTHGVVNTTARLTMMDEPGAVNEATADYFGLQISRYSDWVVGKGLFLKNPEMGLRSLFKPSMYPARYSDGNGKSVSRPYPEKYSEKLTIGAGEECSETNDRCFVHLNSTILSHGYYWMHRALGKSKTQDIVFRALVHYYKENTGFKAAGKALRQACADLHGGSGSDVCSKVDAALKRVEI